MSVYKEGYYAIKLIEQNSKRIYPDACDFGAPIKVGDEIWNWAKQLCSWYGVEGTKKVDAYSTGTTVTQTVELGTETRPFKVTRYSVTYVTTRGDKNQDGYIYITKL